MNKNKLKFIVFLGFIFLFMLSFQQIKASEYEINVEKVENLVYGNSLKSAKIVGNSSILGNFSFENENLVLNDVGNIELKIVFTPSDVENFNKKEILFETNVEKRRVTIIFDRLLYKQYDGTKEIDLPSYTYSGIINNEVEIEGNLVGTLEASYISDEVNVELSGLTIVGEKKDCYYLETSDYVAKIFPKILEKKGANETILILADNIYINLDSSLKIEVKEETKKIDRNYATFKIYNYDIYNGENKLDIDSDIVVSMKIDKNIMDTKRLKIFELTSEGKYQELEYRYSDDKINFTMNSNSKLVFATNNIEYSLIIIFSGVILFYLIFIMFYRFKNSKIKEY